MNQDTNDLIQELLRIRCPETSKAKSREPLSNISESIDDDVDYDKGNRKQPSTLIRPPPLKRFPNKHHRRPPPPPSPPTPTVTRSSTNVYKPSSAKNNERDSMRALITAENKNHIIKKDIEGITKKVYECETSATHANSALEVEKVRVPEFYSPMCESSRDGTSLCDESTSGGKKVERRKRNREHAKKSRMRKKQFHEDLLVSMSLLQDENEELRSFIRQHLGDDEANRVPSSDNLQKMRVNEESLHKAKDTTIKAQVKKDAERDLKYKTESETLALRDSVRQCEAKIRSLESQLSLSESHLAKAVAETETVNALAKSNDHSRRVAEAKVTELEKTIAAMQGKIARLYATLKVRLSLLTHENATLKESLDSLRQGREDALNELSQVRKEYEELKNLFNHENFQLALERELRTRSEQNEREERNERNALSAQMMDLTKKNAHMETQQKDLNDILEAKWRKILELEECKFRTKETELKVAQEELCILQGKLDEVKRSLQTTFDVTNPLSTSSISNQNDDGVDLYGDGSLFADFDPDEFVARHRMMRQQSLMTHRKADSQSYDELPENQDKFGRKLDLSPVISYDTPSSVTEKRQGSLK